MRIKRVIVVGAAGRDFHDFNVVFRGDAGVRVVAFTAAQIPDIDGRVYPPELAGPNYPEGIPIRAENELEALLAPGDIDEVVFAYSDVTHEHVMHMASRALAGGADCDLARCDWRGHHDCARREHLCRGFAFQSGWVSELAQSRTSD
ncbi:MAG: hypothetical protein HZB38_06740 [Planctomycetes bacterium]|nr:hypothetical protein [Planctomycetota bacterium]